MSDVCEGNVLPEGGRSSVEESVETVISGADTPAENCGGSPTALETFELNDIEEIESKVFA